MKRGAPAGVAVPLADLSNALPPAQPQVPPLATTDSGPDPAQKGLLPAAPAATTSAAPATASGSAHAWLIGAASPAASPRPQPALAGPGPAAPGPAAVAVLPKPRAELPHPVQVVVPFAEERLSILRLPGGGPAALRNSHHHPGASRPNTGAALASNLANNVPADVAARFSGSSRAGSPVRPTTAPAPRHARAAVTQHQHVSLRSLAVQRAAGMAAAVQKATGAKG